MQNAAEPSVNIVSDSAAIASCRRKTGRCKCNFQCAIAAKNADEAGRISGDTSGQKENLRVCGGHQSIRH